MIHKKSVITKTIEVGSSTLVSRFFGIVREMLMVRYLGAGVISDAFVTAFKIPNSLRKIFAEGALSAALVPSLVSLVHQDRQRVNKLLALVFLLFESVVLLLCAVVMVYAHAVITLVAPGFSAEQVAYAVPFLQILMPFIFFISSSAILAGALQAVGHFFIPAFSPVLLNIFFIFGIVLGLWYGTSVQVLCYCILVGGLVQWIVHIIAYKKLGFSYALFDAQTWHDAQRVLRKFVPCLFSMSVAEVSLFIDTSFASYLPQGSVSLLYYGNRFMGIPLGVFAVALSTILLPYFARVFSRSPNRSSFYLLETTKLVFWVTVPATIIMSFFAEKIFYTMFYSSKFSLSQVMEARLILIAFLIGLFFFSLNKILMSMYYALHNTTIPALVAVVGTVVNIVLNAVFMYWYQAVGLALATTVSGIVQACLLLYLLQYRFNVTLYIKPFALFVRNLMVQMTVILLPTLMLYQLMLYGWSNAPAGISYYALDTIFFWCWTGPLICVALTILYMTRARFNVRVYFLD